MALTRLEDAQAAVLALARPGPIVALPLHAATGWLAAPLIARRTQPWADLSAMDGYALGAGDGPWRITHSLPAEAQVPGTLAAGEAARIFTGAPLPAGADRILIQEQALVDDDRLTATEHPAPGRWIRRQGSDFTAGQTLADAGTAIAPGLVALAAMASHATLSCHALPHATLLATGSELTLPGSDGPGLPSSNNPMLQALLASAARVTDRGIVGDIVADIRTELRRFDADSHHPALLLLTGGASVGDHDLVRPALEAEGWTIALHRIAMKPGKPLIVALKGQNIALGLPGNPVSAFVTATLFALPLLRAMAGCPDPLPRHRPAILAAPLAAGGNRVEYLRGVTYADGSVAPIGSQDSAALSTLARADALIRVDIDAPPQDRGTLVRIIAIA
jgi:molybdopterin molybdotransferase